jgi:hypothetical protein
MNYKKSHTAFNIDKDFIDVLTNLDDFLILRQESIANSNGAHILSDCGYAECVNQHLSGQMDHYFIEEGLPDFFLESVKNIENVPIDILPRIENAKGETTVAKHIRNEVMTNATKGVCLHFHKSENLQSIAFFVCEFDGKPLGLQLARWLGDSIQDALSGLFVVIGKESHAMIGFLDGYMSSKNVNITIPSIRIVLGFCMYIKYFPDLIKKHEPESLNYGMIKGRRFCVNKGDVAREDITNSRSPHWRRGHFRLLSSEAYKTKKGQIIFVKGTFVKGKAYEVVSD